MATKAATKKGGKTPTKFDVYDHINKVVLEGIEKEGLSWFKSWKDNTGPINRASKTSYRGINMFWLNWVCMVKGYDHNQWLTFKQISDLGGKLHKDSKSTEVFLYQTTYFHKESGKYFSNEAALVAAGISLHSPHVKKCFTLRYFNVFNIGQVDGIEPLTFDAKDFEPHEAAADLCFTYLRREKIRVDHGQPSYNPVWDNICMPEETAFADAGAYYKTLFHEMAHSTGHKDRLDRGLTTPSIERYSKEELVAEISSMYLAGELGVQSSKDDEMNSTAYIQGWVKHLKDHKFELVSAMTNAAKAIEFIKNK